MKCPTCDHAMDALGNDHWWCPNCGSLGSSRIHDIAAHAIPQLVEKCRKFARWPGMSFHPEWRRVGIPECIGKPRDHK